MYQTDNAESLDAWAHSAFFIALRSASVHTVCLLLVLWAALTHGAQLRCFRCLFTLLASEIPLKKGSVSGCPQRGLCFSYVRVLMCVLMCITATCVLWCVRRQGFLNIHLPMILVHACVRTKCMCVHMDTLISVCIHIHTVEAQPVSHEFVSQEFSVAGESF